MITEILEKKFGDKFESEGLMMKSFEWLKSEGALISFLILFIFASINYQYFLTPLNMTNVLRQVSMIGLMTIGMTFVIITGGIDLSVGSVFAVAGVLAAKFSGLGIFWAIVLPLLAAAGLGLINGLVVTKLKIEPFIATLAMLLGARGLAYIITNQDTIRVSSEVAASFSYLGRGKFLGLAVPIWIFIIVAVVAAFIAKKTRFGRTIYAIGGNETGAKMMGLKVTRTKLMVYIISSVLAGLGGIILASRLGAGQPVAGEMYELKAILGTVIGGTLITGGVGKIRGSFIGALILGTIENIFNMQGNIDAWWRNIFMGLILLGVVIIQSQIKKNRE